ncbi:hypothetical protein CIRMBP1274_01729 [Enterococcus cecorum]|nr:hypothetical protein CIRMBP1274_01729 [Enterococcus cecorum]CAI3512922.1 hypothetical protein CIRMBP1319_02435 [Enterococcus cecorum]CAI3519572.1 hypothetical protein CIRMBP1288_01636 [Enterococcus cecorum]
MELHLREKGRNIKTIHLEHLPRRGDIISTTDLKAPFYLVLRVEHVIGHESINLHVREFPNEICAVNAIDGFK